jgi:transcription termination factor Rho
MYDIIELNEKQLSELQEIAQSLGITKVDALSKQDLIYKILDQQAIQATFKKSRTNKSSEEEKEKKKITVRKRRRKGTTAEETTTPEVMGTGTATQQVEE